MRYGHSCVLFGEQKADIRLILKFKKEWEYEEWGQRNAAPLNADYVFEIDEDGNWTADFWWDYEQDPYDKWDDKYWIENGVQKMSVDPWSPVWAIMDFTRDNSNAVVRARKLAWKSDVDKKSKDPYNAYDPKVFHQHEKQFLKYRNLDLSFKHEWKGTGKWIV